MLTPDLPVIILLGVILAALEHVAFCRLAKHFEWARLTKPQAYIVGVGSFGFLCFAHAYLNGQLLTFWRMAMIVAAFGLTVKALWVVDPERPEEWEGIGDKELTTDARAAVDMARLLHNAGVDALQEGIQAFLRSDEFLGYLQTYHKGEGAALPRKQAKRYVAKKVGERHDQA